MNFKKNLISVDHSHSGQYSAKATNSAGEATSMADVLVVDPPPPTVTDSSSLFCDLVVCYDLFLID